jgi:hypothetical protein
MEFLRMRKLIIAFAAAIIAGCASQQHALTREYFDETTAATISEVVQPWIFVRERPEAAVNAGDYVSVSGVDVNRSGDHRLYLIVRAWSTIDREVWNRFASPTLDFSADGRVITPKLVESQPESIGLNLGNDKRGTNDKPGLRRWVYAIDPEQCVFLSRASQVRIAMRTGDAGVSLAPASTGGEALGALAERRASKRD